MTKKEAIRLLITAGVRDMTGQGMGVRNTSDERRAQLKEAIKIAWPIAHGATMSTEDERNLLSHWN